MGDKNSLTIIVTIMRLTIEVIRLHSLDLLLVRCILHFPVLAVKPASVADALVDMPNANNKCTKEGHLVALVVAPGIDFHWYRKSINGFWTHKPGSTPATNLDNSGNVIPDPRTADRGPYTDFCTFMVVKHGHIKIRLDLILRKSGLLEPIFFQAGQTLLGESVEIWYKNWKKFGNRLRMQKNLSSLHQPLVIADAL